MVDLLSLPDEILTDILDIGGHTTIVLCQQTCRRMNDLVKGSLALQYTVSLATAGLVDNIPMDVNLADRVKMLANHESAWKDTPWYPIEGYDGILCLAGSSGNMLVFFRLWDDPVRFSRHLVFQKLPSLHKGVPDFTLRTDPDFHVHEFSVDSSQDLLIYAHGNHLTTREVGTNKPHPASSALAGVLSLRRNELPIPTTTRIHGELAACLTTFIEDGSLRLRIFNWVTGKLITEAGGNFSPLRYEFLDAEHIFYSSSEALTSYPNLIVEHIHSSHRTVLALDFPEVAPGSTASCYLSIPQNSMPHTWAKKDAAGHFSDDLSDRLVVLNVVGYGWGGCHSRRKQQQTLHISANALLERVRAHPDGGTVPWEEWGPGNVRVVPRRAVAHETVAGMHSLCGLRALSDHIVRDRYERPVICVYDYHRGRVGKAAALSTPPPQVDSDALSGGGGGAGMWTKRPEGPLPAATSYVLPGGEEELPCLVKEIPIPEGLQVGNLMCVLCEHAIVLLELADRRLGATINRVFYHAL